MGNSWQQRLMKWNMKLQKYMQGRYGVFDNLSRSVLVVSLIILLVNMFLGTFWLRGAVFLGFVLVYYRFFSKKIYLRVNENQKYTAWLNKQRKKISYLKERFQNRGSYSYFSCPDCKQHLRAPKGKGAIKVTCSKCKKQFIKKV